MFVSLHDFTLHYLMYFTVLLHMFAIMLLKHFTHHEILPEKLYGAKIVQYFDKAKKNHEKHRGGVTMLVLLMLLDTTRLTGSSPLGYSLYTSFCVNH